MNARFFLRLLGSLILGCFPWLAMAQTDVAIDSTVQPCVGQSNGAIFSALAGATDFSLVDAATGATLASDPSGEFTGLGAGAYRVRATSGADLDSSVVVTLVETATLVQLDAAVDPACANSPTGIIAADVTVGAAPFSYQLNTGQVSAVGVFSNLPAGTYTITATDARACSDAVSATLSEPAPLTLEATTTAVDCFGETDGEIDVTFSGGAGSYDLTVSGNGDTLERVGATSPEPFDGSLSAGSYLITLTDANGCQASVNAQIDGPTQPLELLVLGSTNTGCAGGAQNSGTITLLAVGGTPSYDYEVDGIMQNGMANVAATITGLGTDTFLPTVTDAQGCTDAADDSVSINSGNVTIDIVGQANVSCAGEDDGFIQVSASGGTLPLDFLLEDGADNVVYEFIDSVTTFVTFPNLGADVYDITITDSLGCDNVRTETITEPTPLTLTTTPTASQCEGVLSGSAMGGAAPYTFFVGGASQGDTLTNLPLSSGNYVVAVQDDNGCLDQDTVQVGVTNPINIIDNTVVVGAATCFDSNDGSISFQFAAGTDADLFIDDGSSVASYAAVAPDSFLVDTLPGGTNYTVLAADGVGCEDSIQFFVGRPSPLSLDVGVDDVACFGEATGRISAQGQGGTIPYQYLLGAPPAQSSGVFNNLLAGSYLVQVVDNQGCSVSLSVSVGEPAAPLSLVGFDATDTVNCQGDSSGLITFGAQGGTPDTAYRYRLLRIPGILVDSDTFNTVVTLDDLTSGNYELTIFDGNGCEVDRIDSIEERQSIAWTSVVVDSVRCAGESNGAATFTGISRGTAPYELSWLNGSGSLSDTIAVSSGEASAVGLPSEAFVFRVSDALGCQRDTSISIPEPLPLALSLGADTLLFIPCDGGDSGRVELFITGGNPGGGLTYVQELAGQRDTLLTNYGDSALFSGLTAQNDSVSYFVEDIRGCHDSLQVRISDAPPLVPTFEPQDSLFCNYIGTIVLRGTGIFSQATFADGNNPVSYLQRDSLFFPGNLPASTPDSQVVKVLIEGFDTTPNGCFFDTTVRLVVYDTLEIRLPIDTTFCSNADNFTIQVDPEGGTLQGQGISQSQDSTFLFIPNLFPKGFTTDLTYTITDSSRAACVSTRVVRYEVIPAPVASFKVLTDPLCEGQTIILAPPDSTGVNYNHSWQFNQDTATKQSGDTARIELALGSNLVEYTLTSTNQTTNCSDTLNRELQVQAVPRFTFDWERICEGDEVQFTGSLTDTSNLSGLDRLTWRWTFDGVGSVEDVLSRSSGRFPPSLVGHRFDTLVADLPDTYLTEVRVRTDSGCVGTALREVTILPELRPRPAQPYDQRFELDSLPWLTLDSAGIWAWVPLDFNDTIGSNAPFGTGNITTKPDSTYGLDQRGSLLSPCFDLSGFDRPVMGLEIWSETALGNDGTVLQYLNESRGSSTWRTLGSVNDGIATGLNWYNRSDIFARPGEPNLQGWSGRFGDWREAIHRLDLVDLTQPASRRRVRFRLAFASDDRPDSDTLAGFAVRRVEIRERRRRVLWETFRDANTNDGQSNAVLTALDSLDSDFLRLSYPLDGPFHDQNATPPRVRSLYYGISLADQGVLDGNQYNGPLQDFILNDLNLRSLQAPGVDSLVVAGELLRIAGVNVSGQASLRLALVQDLADQPGVMRAILPDGAGVISDLAVGVDQAGALEDLFSPNVPLDVAIDSSAPVYGVVWLQDLSTKEVWQAARLDGLAWEALLTNLNLERRAGPPSVAPFDELRVYPVPTQGQLTVAWPEPLRAAWPWRLLDAQGRAVAAGQADAGSQLLQLDLTALSEGLYHLCLRNPATNQWLYRKVSILR